MKGLLVDRLYYLFTIPCLFHFFSIPYVDVYYVREGMDPTD